MFIKKTYLRTYMMVHTKILKWYHIWSIVGQVLSISLFCFSGYMLKIIPVETISLYNIDIIYISIENNIKAILHIYF